MDGPGDDRVTQPFQLLQQQFSARVRDPDANPLPPGIDAKRMAVYERLVYNNIESLLASVFSPFRELLDRATWRALVRAFLREHRIQSPYFREVPDEFLAYLQAREAGPSLPPFTFELCHYLWVIFALPLAPDLRPDAYDDVPVELTDTLSVSPLAWPLQYAFDVTMIGEAHQPVQPPDLPTRLIAYRDRNADMRFLSANARTLRLLALLDDGAPVADVCAALAAELGVPEARVEGAALSMLNRLHEADIVIRAR